ncbi:MAG: CvpA family protein [Verrucomicrobiae bacterium]
MNLASPFWQGMIFLFAALLLLWEIWGGWRRGVIRSAIHFSAFVFSGILGILAGQATAFVVEKVLPGYGFLSGLLAGSLVTLVVLALALLLGAILFKRTEHQPSGLVRMLYGAGGAFFGLLTGLVLVWGGITLIRTFGVAAQVAMAGRPGKSDSPLAKAMLTLKESLELGPAGKVVESVDVLPPEIYGMIVRVGKLTSDREAMVRFLDYPGAQEILRNPRMAALLNNPAVARAAEQKNFLFLMRNRELFEAVQDPALQKQLSEFNLQKALDYAFPAAQASPAPKKIP